MQAVMEKRPGAPGSGSCRGSSFCRPRDQDRRLRLPTDAAARPSSASVPGAGITLDMGTVIDPETEPPGKSTTNGPRSTAGLTIMLMATGSDTTCDRTLKGSRMSVPALAGNKIIQEG